MDAHRAPPAALWSFCSQVSVGRLPSGPQSLVGPSHTYNESLTDVASAELGIGREVYIDHPAAHADTQPDQKCEPHPEAREPALGVGEK